MNMGLAYLVEWDPKGIAQVQVVVTPLGNIPVVQRTERGRCPRHRVHTVRDGANGIGWKHSSRNLAVMHGHTVNVPGAAHRHVGHVEFSLMTAPGPLQHAADL